MIATMHHFDTDLEFDADLGLETASRDDAEFDSWESTEAVDAYPIWDDCGLALAARGEIEERNSILTELIQLTLSSGSSYQELVELSREDHLRSFAEVVVRQRAAQCQELRQQQTQCWDDDEEQPRETLSALRSLWRVALWNYEQHNLTAFVEYAERAESLLEEACLAAAQAFDDNDWKQMLRNHAVMVCGARGLWEELQSEYDDSAWADSEEEFELAVA